MPSVLCGFYYRQNYGRQVIHMAEYLNICQYCGKEFIAKQKQTKFCSRKCRDIDYRIRKGVPCNKNTEPYRKKCAECGKIFDTFYSRVVTCSPECSKAHRKKKDKGRIDKRKKTDYSLEEYNLWRKQQAEERKQVRKIEKQWYRALHTVERECEMCGELFYCLDTEANKTCSAECSKKLSNKKHDRRIPKNQRIDNINIRRLYKRDGGKCYICGGKCDFNDWRTSGKGNKYPGDKYPTIEHIFPVSRGGLDAWDNVKLACWKCNLNKSDGIIHMMPMDKIYAYSQKAEIQAKKTAQYTLDGELIKIWNSTAQIKRELGLNDKHIQNVCRGDNSNTGNAYGYHWEYVI